MRTVTLLVLSCRGLIVLQILKVHLRACSGNEGNAMFASSVMFILRIQSWVRYQCLSILYFLHVFILHAILRVYSMSKLQVSVSIHNCTN